MSVFVKVIESRYGDNLLLNVDNISVVNVQAGKVLMNGTHGESTGWYNFAKPSMKKIVDAIILTTKSSIPCTAHSMVNCREH